MINRFLKRFSTKSEKTALVSVLQGKQKIRAARASKLPSSIIEVPAGQTCVISACDGEIHIFPAGTHELTSHGIKLDVPLDYLYLIDGAKCSGTWSLQYLDHEQISVALSGSYTVKLDKPLALARSCFKKENFKDENNFSDWIARSITTILKTQRIPAHDIHSENERFANFLSNVLSGTLRHKGLLLQAISMNINTISAKPEPIEEDDHELNQDTDTTTDTEEKQNTVEQVIAHQEPRPEKLFYYVRNAQQYGPFSHDDIREKLANGELKKRDLLWQKGMTTWKAIADFQEFQ